MNLARVCFFVFGVLFRLFHTCSVYYQPNSSVCSDDEVSVKCRNDAVISTLPEAGLDVSSESVRPHPFMQQKICSPSKMFFLVRISFFDHVGPDIFFLSRRSSSSSTDNRRMTVPWHDTSDPFCIQNGYLELCPINEILIASAVSSASTLPKSVRRRIPRGLRSCGRTHCKRRGNSTSDSLPAACVSESLIA